MLSNKCMLSWSKKVLKANSTDFSNWKISLPQAVVNESLMRLPAVAELLNFFYIRTWCQSLISGQKQYFLKQRKTLFLNFEFEFKLQFCFFYRKLKR